MWRAPFQPALVNEGSSCKIRLSLSCLPPLGALLSYLCGLPKNLWHPRRERLGAPYVGHGNNLCHGSAPPDLLEHLPTRLVWDTVIPDKLVPHLPLLRQDLPKIEMLTPRLSLENVKPHDKPPMLLFSAASRYGRALGGSRSPKNLWHPRRERLSTPYVGGRNNFCHGSAPPDL